jgi:flagellar basal-body rod protein FlgC
MFGNFDISASALGAQKMRLETIASNIASADAVIGPDGKTPYRRKFPIFEAQRTESGGAGVRVGSIQDDMSPFREKYEPWNPLRDAKGNVKYPNVDLSIEYVNALDTTRAYEANVTAIETTKSMLNATLRLLG